MKKDNKLKAVIAALLLGIAPGVFAQTSEGAYWVIEGNVQDPSYTLIHYYDASHQLIKDEKLEGKYLDITKRKYVRFLNKKLDELTNVSSKVKNKDSRKRSSSKMEVKS